MIGAHLSKTHVMIEPIQRHASLGQTHADRPARSSEEFESIAITGIDKDRSGPSSADEAWEVHLMLSSWATGEWIRLFQSTWMSSRYEGKPRITAYRHQLVLHSTLEDVEDHLAEVSRVVEETNRAYRERLDRRGAEVREREERDRLARARLEELEQRLGFA